MNSLDQSLMNRMSELGEVAEAFIEELYLEHLDEASFLYTQRLNSMKEPYRSWQDLEKIERRIQAHIEALVRGGEKALEVCLEQMEEGGPGALYVAVRVFCRRTLDEPVKELLANLDPLNTDKVNAVINALNHDLPVEWHPFVEQMLLSSEPLMVHVALSVTGYRRLPMEHQVMGLLNCPHDDTYGIIIRTLGCLRAKSARNQLSSFFRNDKEPDSIKQELRMALLRLGEKGIFPVPADRGGQEPWVYLSMGLSGGAAHAAYLKEISRSDGVCNESLLALGLLGDSSSVDILISHLNGGTCSEAASLALHLITGADLYEDVFIPDPIDEDTLFADEREKLKRGEPLYEPGKEPGETVNCLSQDSVAWQNWWMTYKPGFEPHIKYRHGKPPGPSGILEILESEKNPAFLRQLAYEEFVIRYELDFRFDITLPVSEQRKIISNIKKRIEGNGFK
jgi:uncharacterized protein (TIGR02270 family)